MNQKIFLGAIADDVTGASDLAINLVKGGMRVVQFLSIPTADQLDDLNCDAVVVALKTRSIPANEAVAQSVAAIETLRAHGCQRFFFKYCSTFDSTPKGNIGQVTDALLKSLGTDRTILCPAFPEAGRTVYQGHLFVGDRLLNDCGMQHHPLNPMTDPDLVRVARLQSHHDVGLVDFQTINDGSQAITSRIEQLVADGRPLVVTDCCNNSDLEKIAEAVCQMTLVTGGSGIGRFLPGAWRKDQQFGAAQHQPTVPKVAGKTLIIAGSCSTATQGQVQHMKDRCQNFQVNVAELVEDKSRGMKKIEQLAEALSADQPLMIYSTASPEEIEDLREKFGQDTISATVEQFHADVALALVEHHGFRRLLLAGGETSGAVVAKLKIDRLYIGPEICTGVPWTETRTENNLAIALKSGNFGDERFFETAVEMLDQSE